MTLVKRGGKPPEGTAGVNLLQAPASSWPGTTLLSDSKDISWSAAEAEGSSLPESTSTDASQARRKDAGYTADTALRCPVPPQTLRREDAIRGHKR